MLVFSYTISPTLRVDIEKIEKVRRDILTELIPRPLEIQLTWEAYIDRALHASWLSNNKQKKSDIIKSNGTNPYINTYRWINRYWYLNPNKIMPQDIKRMYSVLDKKITFNDKELDAILTFVQTNNDHPIIKSGVAFVLATSIFAKNLNALSLSIPFAAIFLYKYGFDLKGLIDVEEHIVKDKEHFENLLRRGYETGNISTFLEYYSEAILISTGLALKKIKDKDVNKDLPTYYFLLTERQKEIMSLFDDPQAKVTNKIVQKKFNISQITASRDLAKLLKLGAVHPNGKGRSIYYTIT